MFVSVHNVGFNVIITFIFLEITIPKCDVSFANGTLYHLTLTMSRRLEEKDDLRTREGQ